jgi:hypothetical protein
MPTLVGPDGTPRYQPWGTRLHEQMSRDYL